MYSKFEKLMKEHKYTFSQIGRATGISPSTFTDWRAGRYTPKQDKIEKLANFFHVPISYFTEDNNGMVYSISSFEFDIISNYRNLSDEQKITFLKQLDLSLPSSPENKTNIMDVLPIKDENGKSRERQGEEITDYLNTKEQEKKNWDEFHSVQLERKKATDE